jgi:hypothetical protein
MVLDQYQARLNTTVAISSGSRSLESSLALPESPVPELVGLDLAILNMAAEEVLRGWYEHSLGVWSHLDGRAQGPARCPAG